MAEGSKKGACSSNTQRAKANTLEHARRTYKTLPSYINPHRMHLNRTVFEDDVIKGRKSIVPLVRKARELYTEKVGQKCQDSFAPFQESALVIREGITDEQLLQFRDKVEQMTGWKCIGIWVHEDEGHYRSKYIEGDTSFAINHHAHVLWDCQNHETGTIKRIKGKGVLSRMQDLLAEATGMERGNYAKDTGRRHRDTMQQRIETQEERLSQLHDAALIEGIKGKFGLSSKDKQLKEQKGKNKALRQQLAEVPAQLATAKAEGAEIAKKAAKREADKVEVAHRNEVSVLKAQISALEAERDNAIVKANNAAQETIKAVEREKKAFRLVSIYDRLLRLLPITSKAIQAIEQAALPHHSDVWEDAEEEAIYDAMGGDAMPVENRKEIGRALLRVAAEGAEDSTTRSKILSMEHWSMEPLAEQGAEARSRNNGYSR